MAEGPTKRQRLSDAANGVADNAEGHQLSNALKDHTAGVDAGSYASLNSVDGLTDPAANATATGQQAAVPGPRPNKRRTASPGQQQVQAGNEQQAASAVTEAQQQHQQQQQHVLQPAQQRQQGVASAADKARNQQQEQPAPAGAAGGQAEPQQQQQQQAVAQVPVGAYTQREEHLQRQEASGEIEFAYVVNDGQAHNMIRLMGLKVIFSKQLPNMPREYICRLLLDRRHRSCALLAKNGSVLGGITYRLFPQQGFGEIAFCAIAASQQVRGFGTRLMNHTKAFASARDNLTHFLTYADNNAVGYFTKQGFTREISLPRERWVGFIKDYDGGTLMECVIHPKLPYTDLVSLFRVQKEYLDGQIRQLSNSHVVHPGIPRQRMPLGHARVQELAVPISPGDIPGVKEAGWSPSASIKAGYRLVLHDSSVVEPTPANLQRYMAELLSAIESQDGAWPFRAPVDPSEALDYYDIILDPVDLTLVAARLAAKQYYISLEMFVADIRKMCDNCRYYNAQTTPYYQCASKLQSFMESYLDATIVEAAAPAAPQQQQ